VSLLRRELSKAVLEGTDHLEGGEGGEEE